MANGPFGMTLDAIWVIRKPRPTENSAIAMMLGFRAASANTGSFASSMLAPRISPSGSGDISRIFARSRWLNSSDAAFSTTV